MTIATARRAPSSESPQREAASPPGAPDLELESTEEVREQLREALETIDAIRSGSVDSLVIGAPGEERVYSIVGADRSYRLLVETMADGAAILSAGGAILYANPRLGEIVGRPSSKLVGTPAVDLATVESRAAMDRVLAADPDGSTGSRERVAVELDLLTADGRIRSAHVAVSPFDLDGVRTRTLLVTDLTERVGVARELARANEALRMSEASVRATNRALQMISRVIRESLRATDESELMRASCQIAVDVGGYALVWVGLADDSAGKPVRPVAVAGSASAFVQGTRVSWAARSRRQGLTGRVIRRGVSQVVRSIERDPVMSATRSEALAAGLHGLASAPLVVEGRVIGAITFYVDRADAFDASELELVEEMARDLGFAIGSLRAAARLRIVSERLRTVLDASLVAIAIGRDAETITFANDRCLALLGGPPTAADEDPLRREVIVPPEWFGVIQHAINDASASDGMTSFETEVQCSDGRSVAVLVGASALPGAKHEVAVFLLDISDRRRAEEGLRTLNVELEERVAARSASLERANRDLEAFSYSVSHDLRAPLRAIQGFSRIMVEEHASQLDQEGHRVLGVVVQNTRQMGTLIDGLLAFSRFGRAEVAVDRVDMSDLVRSVISDLTPGGPNHPAVFDVDDLDEAQGDARLLRQVWSNLLGNAVKYSFPVASPRIEVRSERSPGECRYVVSDNGVGFDPAHADKVFQPFQRLHDAADFEGSGIGLAIVARIVERHGGRVWAEGKPGTGASFGFSLPVAESMQ